MLQCFVSEPSSFIVDEEMVELLRAKEHNIYIWCYAKTFVARHKLKGYSCDMFISEVEEAMYVGLQPLPSQEQVDIATNRFCEMLGEYAMENTAIIDQNVTKQYGVLAVTNAVAAYNHMGLKAFLVNEDDNEPLVASRHHIHPLVACDMRRVERAVCNMCLKGGKCVLFCASCDWDICDTCLECR